VANIISFDSNSIIDMGTMQTIANAINKHDDALGALTNNMASSIVPVTNTNLLAAIFDFSSSMIQYGHSRLSLTAGTTRTVDHKIDFASAFKGNPIVITTAQLQRSIPNVVVVTTLGYIGPSYFHIQADITNDSTPPSLDVDINWIAIGSHAS
jgi:hypothetical protein